MVKVNQNNSKLDCFKGPGYRVRIQGPDTGSGYPKLHSIRAKIKDKIKDKINRIGQLPYTKVNVVKVNQNNSKLDCFKAKIKRYKGPGSGYRVRIQVQLYQNDSKMDSIKGKKATVSK